MPVSIIYAYVIECIYKIRCVDSRKVWYEWCMTSPVQTPIQNSGGSSYSIGL